MTRKQGSASPRSCSISFSYLQPRGCNIRLLQVNLDVCNLLPPPPPPWPEARRRPDCARTGPPTCVSANRATCVFRPSSSAFPPPLPTALHISPTTGFDVAELFSDRSTPSTATLSRGSPPVTERPAEPRAEVGGRHGRRPVGVDAQ